MYMKKQWQHTVEGLQDLHPQDTSKKQFIEAKILDVFQRYGYEQVETPTFEYFDIYHHERGTEDSKNLYKFFNREGEILSLRPDVTPSIARYTATFYGNETTPQRFSYRGNVFYNNENYQGKLREYTQAGIECIGIPYPEADAECVVLAIQSLLASGLNEFQIDLGHVGFFMGLIEEAGLTEEEEEEVRQFIDAKNYIALEAYLETVDISSQVKKGLLELPRLFGQEDILTRAMALTTNSVAQNAISRLVDVYYILKDYGFETYISFDLGMVSKLQYYTGIIFKGYTYGTGVSIVNGGRYDRLLQSFDYNMPAVGFAIPIHSLLQSIMRQNIAIDTPSIQTFVGYEYALQKEAIALAETLRQQGMTLALDCNRFSWEECVEYGQKKNFGGVMYICHTERVKLINLTTNEVTDVDLNMLGKEVE